MLLLLLLLFCSCASPHSVQSQDWHIYLCARRLQALSVSGSVAGVLLNLNLNFCVRQLQGSSCGDKVGPVFDRRSCRAGSSMQE